MSINLNNVKEQIQTIFQAANTTTATRDLSNGLETRVKSVLKINPSRIPVQASWYPFVTCYIDSKDIELVDFAINQTSARRKAKIDIKVVGSVWNSSIVDEEVDPADEDCEDLMENIEEILRANPTLGGVVTWAKPTAVTYHNVGLDEGTHIRAGILNLEADIFY
jgi:hypothetical protein